MLFALPPPNYFYRVVLPHALTLPLMKATFAVQHGVARYWKKARSLYSSRRGKMESNLTFLGPKHIFADMLVLFEAINQYSVQLTTAWLLLSFKKNVGCSAFTSYSKSNAKVSSLAFFTFLHSSFISHVICITFYLKEWTRAIEIAWFRPWACVLRQ